MVTIPTGLGHMERPGAPTRAERAAIQAHYEQLKRAPGAKLGITEFAAGGGVVQKYEHGAIYYKPSTGAWHVYGAIYEKYLQLGGDAGFLGYPVSDENYAPDKRGRFSDFENGSIYWSPEIGAMEVHGGIRAYWDKLGGAASYLGYPVSDEGPQGNQGRISHFQYGWIEWFGYARDYPIAVTFHEKLRTRTAVDGWHEVRVNARGEWTFTGHWHNSGGIGIDGTLVVALNFKFPDGSALGFSEQDYVEGQLVPGDSDHNWTRMGTDDRLRKHFPALRNVGITHNFDGSTTVGAVIGLVLAAVPAAVGMVLLAAVAGGTKKVCGPYSRTVRDPHTGDVKQEGGYTLEDNDGKPCPPDSPRQPVEW